MQTPDSTLSPQDLQKQRELIRRGLVRSNTAATVILLVVIGLAIGAVIEAFRADRYARASRDALSQAEQHYARAQEELWKSYLAQARAGRLSGVVGRRIDSLAAVNAAAQMRPSLELRNEAIAALSLTDLDPTKIWQPLLTPMPAWTFDPDLEHYAFGDMKGTVSVVRASDSKEIARFSNPGTIPYEVLFSRDGQSLAVRYSSNELKLWSLRETELRFTATNLAYAANGLDFSPDSRIVAVSVPPKRIHFYETATARALDPLVLDGEPRMIRFDPTGQRLAIAITNRIEIWDWSKRERVQTLRHPTSVEFFAWHPDGTRLAASCLLSSEILVTDGATGRQRVLRGHNGPVIHLSFRPHGDILASASWDGTTRLWNSGSGRQLISSHSGYADEFSRDGERLAFYRENAGIGIWRLSHTTTYRSLHAWNSEETRSVDISADGQWLASTSNDGLRLWDLDSGKAVAFGSLRRAFSVQFEPNRNSLLACGWGGLTRWPYDVNTNQSSRSAHLDSPQSIPLPANQYIEHLALSPDGRNAAVTLDNRAVLFDLSDPARFISIDNIPNLTRVAISPDKNWVATGTWHGRGTCVWDAHSGKLVHDFGGRSACVTFSPDSRSLVIATGEDFRIWTTGNWQLLHRIPRDSGSEGTGHAVFARDGSMLALSQPLGEVLLIDPHTGQEIATLIGPEPETISAMAFSHDGGRLAAATLGETIQIWNLGQIHQELAALNLDWPSSDVLRDQNSPASVASGAMPFSALSMGGWRLRENNPFIIAAVMGVAVAVLLAILQLQRHRKLVESYERIDNLVAQRSRELEVAQSGLLQSQKMKALGTLAAGIAHDFNNLLSVIRLSNDFIRRSARSDPDVHEETESIENAVQQGKEVVRSMLGYSREEAANTGTFAVPDVIADTVALLSKQFLSGILLTLEVDRQCPVVQGSQSRLEQMLLNLLVNASEAMKGQGKLMISVRPIIISPETTFVLRPRPAANYVEVAVSDSGPGI
ncbi:MAG: histidine kinase dimerization/phospho-acceptor domain-containing protein, partial [Verrucomicrobiota bacterium]